MSYTIRPAVRENVGLFIGLAGGTSAGKTVSAMKLASGIVGPGKRFGVVDTENRRASHEADDFAFDVIDLEAPYSSKRYEEAVLQMYKAGYKAIIVDSATHEHDAVGGYLDMQATDLHERVERAKKKNPNVNEWELADKLTPLSWVPPKRDRKRMMQTLLACSVNVPIIFCFRAEEKAFMSKEGKLVAQNPPVWAPVCGKSMPFEMTVFFMLHRERPGVPVPVKLGAKHKSLFPLDEPITEESGRRIAEWAAGSTKHLSTDTPADAKYITPNQVLDLETMCKDSGVAVDRLKHKANVTGLPMIRAEHYKRTVEWLKSVTHKDAA